MLIPDTLMTQLVQNGHAHRDNPGLDPRPVVKLFTPDGGAAWLLSQVDPEDNDLAYGLCDLGQGTPELGYVSLTELASVKGPLGLAIERDWSFRAELSISEYARRAVALGTIRD
ncbi:DUF2958 domain-containing protein [Brevundimonas variabilis]|uniref:Uncharacterized protein n=1 Tax=Brevundimonas variabilis TaxID=74312 RepID=A0A7W9CK73_9CAUL|nr:DUF2958 domain-containing protein [Brevundimonas variabilis]MBB5747061.1 hypothetical protein [Brevundimonas variabilis]